ncbi:MAG: TonB-dependent receptor [Gammaproteobacteria bacterium]|nr:TonB-dependent receptor [Gammaproteobacteria bacterium]
MINHNSYFSPLLAALMVMSGALAPGSAGAQSSRQHSDMVPLPEEVVVTARKREETVLDAPLSITALGADQIEARKLRGLTDLAVSMPNVALDEVGTARGISNFSIRGLGINSSIPSIDPTVGIFVDGVYIGSNTGAAFDTFNLESIEVLRGPQGILFGRNVTGGAILVNTRKPGDEFEARVRTALDGGGDGGLNKYLMGSAGGPVGDSLSVGITAYYNDDDGWFENKLTGDDFGALEQVMIRPVVVWRPTARMELVLRYQYSETEGDGSASQTHTNGLGIDGKPANFDRDSHDFSIDGEGFQDSETHFVAAELNLEVGENGVVTNIFGYRSYESELLSDIDAQPVSLFHGGASQDIEQVSNELRYHGVFAERFNLTTGVYYFNNDINYHERRNLLGLLTPDGSPALLQDGGGEYQVETIGVFAAVDYDLNDAITLSAGLRYTTEEKEAGIATLVRNVNSPCNVLDGTCPFDFTDAEEWDSWSPKVGMTYHISDAARIYAHWTRGFRSGGYNLRNTAIDTVNLGPGPFGEETVDNYEIGFKASFAQGYLSGALFFNDIEDMQREINLADPFSGVVQVIKNTADAEILGIELDGAVNLTDDLQATGSAGWLDADYKDVTFDLNSDGMIDGRDKDLDLPRAAEWTWSLGLRHHLQVGDLGHLDTRIRYSYRDESSFTDNNLGYILSQKILDAGLDFHTEGGHWTFSVYGKNLLDEVKHGGDAQLPSRLGPIPLGGAYAPLAKGRVIGGEVTFTF